MPVQDQSMVDGGLALAIRAASRLPRCATCAVPFIPIDPLRYVR
jgi:hypothetical protein